MDNQSQFIKREAIIDIKSIHGVDFFRKSSLLSKDGDEYEILNEL
jgi:hypothetical protein